MGFLAEKVLKRQKESFASRIIGVGFGAVTHIAPLAYGGDEAAVELKLGKVLTGRGFLEMQSVGNLADGHGFGREQDFSERIDALGVGETFADIAEFTIGHDGCPFGWQ